MRDLVFLLLFLPLFVVSIRNGFAAYLLWCWAGLVAIQSYLYGFMTSIPYVQLFAVIALLHFLVGKDPERISFKLNRTTVLFIVFSFHITLCALFAFQGHPRNWDMATNMIKTVLFCVLMPMVVTSRYRIHAILLVIAIATSFHGMIDGLKFIASGGHHMARGIQKFGDNNHYAMVLIMVIPLLAYLYKYSAVRWVRLSFLAIIPLMIFSVIATQSRGGLICLAAVGLWFLLTSKHKFAGAVVVLLCAFLAFGLASDAWLARMETINNAGEDSSMLGRIGAWQVSTAIALRNPVFGGGPLSVELGSVWREFQNSQGLLGFLPMDLNGLPGRGRATHSIYFQSMGDLGFVGFFLFIAILMNAYFTARSVIKICKATGPQLDWAHSLAQMLTIALLAYAVAGALLSAVYFDLPYVLFMLIQVLKIQVDKEVPVVSPREVSFVGVTRRTRPATKLGVGH